MNANVRITKAVITSTTAMRPAKRYKQTVGIAMTITAQRVKSPATATRMPPSTAIESAILSRRWASHRPAGVEEDLRVARAHLHNRIARREMASGG
jgi:hypothetical protein